MKEPTVAELSALDVSLEEQGYDVPRVSLGPSYGAVIRALAELRLDLEGGRALFGPRMARLVDELQGQVRVDDVRAALGPPIEPR